jgi:hypothetical protein
MSDERPQRIPLWQIGVLQALIFGVGWGAFMYYLSWKDKGTPIATAIGLSVLAGLLFGGTMTWFEARRRKKEDAALAEARDDDHGGNDPA